MEFKEKLKKYSETIIKIGANVQKGQMVIIRANIEAKDFVRSLIYFIDLLYTFLIKMQTLTKQ